MTDTDNARLGNDSDASIVMSSWEKENISML